MKKSKLINTALMFLAAMIWGASFVAQSEGAELVETFTFMGIRTTMGGLCLLPVIWFLDKKKPAAERKALLPLESDKKLLEGGIVCGLIMAVASNLQQLSFAFGIDAGKCGFITSFYVMLVPIFSVLLFRRRYRWPTWLGVAIALCGMYLLMIKDDFSINKSDLIVFACAIGFAFHILAIDHYVAQVDGVRLSCLQFLVCGISSLIMMFIFENPNLGNILKAWLPLCYSGILSCAVAYTLQVVCQKHVEPALASLILSLESVFSVLAGWLLLHELLSNRDLLGCLLTFTAVVIVELTPAPAEKKA